MTETLIIDAILLVLRVLAFLYVLNHFVKTEDCKIYMGRARNSHLQSKRLF